MANAVAAQDAVRAQIQGRKAELEAALTAAAQGTGVLSVEAMHCALSAAGCDLVRHQVLTLFRAQLRAAGGDVTIPDSVVPLEVAVPFLCGSAA